MALRRKIVAIVAGLLLAAGGIGFALTAVLQDGPDVVEPQAFAPAQASPPPSSAPAPRAAEAVGPPAVASPPARPVLDIVVTGTAPFTGTLEPATFEDIDQIVDEAAGYGTSASHTAFILAHARTPWRGHSPGNDWLELTAGDAVNIGGLLYRVTTAGDVAKTNIADAPIWSHVPGRVVLITCLPRLDGQVATHNRFVILEAG